MNKLKKLCKHLAISGLQGSGLILKKRLQGSSKQVGDSVGYFDGKYWRIDIKGVSYKCHHIVYAIHNNKWSIHNKMAKKSLQMCHIDDNADNNTPSNLLLASQSWNQQMKRPFRGYKGVHWCSTYKVWLANCTIGGERVSLGRHGSARDAAITYDEYVKVHGCPYAYTNFNRSK